MKNGVECPIDRECGGIKPDGSCDGRCFKILKEQIKICDSICGLPVVNLNKGLSPQILDTIQKNKEQE